MGIIKDNETLIDCGITGGDIEVSIVISEHAFEIPEDGDLDDRRFSAAEWKGFCNALLPFKGERLSLIRCGIDGKMAEEMFEALSTDMTLEFIYLGMNRIGDMGVKELSKALCTNRTLQVLYLNANQIGDSGAEEIAKALSANRTLRHLNLSGNQIGDSGADDFSKAFSANNTLQEFYIHGNQIGDDCKKELRAAWNQRSRFFYVEMS